MTSLQKAGVLFFLLSRLKLYFDHGEIKRYNGKRRMNDLKAFVNKFLATSEVRFRTFVLLVIIFSTRSSVFHGT